MVKSSVLFALLLGVVFAQMIQAIPSLDSGTDNSGGDETDDKESKNQENDAGRPALICLLFENLGCNTKCSITADAFSLQGTGECTEKNVCQCTIEQDETLEGLFRAKFKAEAALKRIKRDKDLSAKVLEILRRPFQTSALTKHQLRDVVSPEIYKRLYINDTTPVRELYLVGEKDVPFYDLIKTYVSEKLTPILESSSKQLKSVNYKSSIKKALKENTNENLQGLINEVRLTKNKNLNNIVNNYLKSTKINEESTTEEDNIADTIGHQIIDQFITYIEQKETPSAKKPAHRPSTKNAKKSNTSSDSRFNLPGPLKESIKKIGKGGSQTFTSEGYAVYYDKTDEDDFFFTWSKLSKEDEEVRMNISPNGSVRQYWFLGSVVIKLKRSSDGSKDQYWDFVKSQYTYNSTNGTLCASWNDGKEDAESLEKYQKLIDEWCDKNDFLFSNKKQCIIY